jgi:amino acid adenylation domain-containing protein
LTDTFPLSEGQKSLWFMHQTLRNSSAYHIGLAVRILSPLDAGAIEKALQHLLDRHAALRTVFLLTDNGELRQQVAESQRIAFEQTDASDWTAERLKQEVRNAYARPFDLAAGPLMRAALFAADGRAAVLLITVHHIVFDGKSMFTMLSELQELYAALQAGSPVALRPLKHSYREFVEWQSQILSGAGTSDLAYWQNHIENAPAVLDMPTDHPRPAHFSGRGGSVVFELPEELMRRLRQLAKDKAVHLFDVFAAAYHVLLHRYSGQNDILLGFITAGRPELRFARLIGLFSNPVVLRGVLTGDPTFTEFLIRQHETLSASLAHQNLPFLTLIEKSRVARLPGYMPLIQVLFNYFKIPRTAPFAELFVTGHDVERVQSPGLEMEAFGLEQNEGEFDLVLEVAEGSRCWARIKYSADLFDHATVGRMTEHYQNLLLGIADGPDRAVSRLPLLGETERRRMLAGWNETPAQALPDCCVHELFERQAAENPDRTAVLCKGARLMYAELNRSANALAHYLKAQGVGPEVLVGVCIERSMDMLVALLAILKAGGAYVPLDPHFPKARLDLILEDAQPLLVLTERRLAHLVSNGQTRLLEVDTERESYCSGESGNPPRSSGASNLAYVLFTSGSTGRPKGVQIPHSAFVNFLVSMQKRPGLIANDVLLAVTTISFDIAGLELMLPLIAGAQVVIATREMAIDGRRLAAAIDECGVSVMQATPATWRLLLDSGWTGAKGLKALCGGEALSRELADELLARVGSLWNMYGPTETTVWSTVHKVEPGEGAIPLGTAVDNTPLYILDPASEPVPIGVSGELHIGGAGLARGYLNRPDLTGAKFIRDPFGEPGGRLYKTGDVCRYHADGSIAFLGRLDDQVKIRGHRIELGDIESVLLRHPRVNEAAVVVNEDPAAGKRLVAYMTGVPGGPPASGVELREHLAKELPDYMIPAAFVYLDALPLTPNNKVDRKSLRTAPLPAIESAREDTAPQSETEVVIAKLWSEILGVRQPGTHAKFDELGGDSLSFALMIVRLSKALQVDLPIRMDEEMLTIAGLAKIVDGISGTRKAEVAAVPASPPAVPAVVNRPRSGRFFLGLGNALVRMLAHVELDGIENVPTSGPLILAGNHISLFDFVIFGSVLGGGRSRLPVTPTFIIADKWRRRINAYAAQLGNPIYIRRGQGDLHALGGALEVLAADGAVAIMPEGKPTRGALSKAKPGVAYLALQRNAPVVPIAVYGHDRVLDYWPRLRRVPVRIRIGAPFHLGTENGRHQADYQQQADMVMTRIARLMPAEYHGFYAGHTNGTRQA